MTMKKMTPRQTLLTNCKIWIINNRESWSIHDCDWQKLVNGVAEGRMYGDSEAYYMNMSDNAWERFWREVKREVESYWTIMEVVK